MNTHYLMEDELTGLEEHLRDEAWECGEMAAMRAEAHAEWEAENSEQEYLNAKHQAEWEAQQADPLRAVCDFGRDAWGNRSKCCEDISEEDNIPF